eukprot:CAMPEP_0202972100 /NCGR_PEP_ID=MMETSP1396-20130829/33384_1 /ASSEMBLY_ACC=CAM_ASM_000872 /TAXON_ID= /ORGANISM="Pseudokeronopsis sp., Strain Brazil" /LENGTH=536 /DNA_ID=CAMNT_0049702147 /DNA_START=34 /DNA_END=1644 /DNA_ORIENTATION=-
MLRLRQAVTSHSGSIMRAIFSRTAPQITCKNFSTISVGKIFTDNRNNATRFGAVRYLSVVTENLDTLGESITSAVVLSWSKQPGDSVREDDVIAVVETDKVTMDIRAKRNGVFVEAIVPATGEVTVGSPLYKIDSSATAGAATPSSKNVAPSSSPNAPSSTSKSPSAESSTTANVAEVTVPVPIMGESITTGVLATWFKNSGDSVNADEVVATIDTDKVSVEVRSPQSGIISKVFASAGDEITVGGPLFLLKPGASVPSPKKAEPVAPIAKPSPSVSEDKKPETSPKKTVEASPAPAVPLGARSETRVKMTRMRKVISKRLKDSQNTAAMLTTFQEVDMSALMEMRNKYKDDFEKVHGVKLGFMSAFVRASTLALKEIPAVNAVIDDETQEIVFRNFVDVSVAVASPTGLVVPVLRNTENMGFADIEKAIAMYGKKAKDGSLLLEDMVGGTFTISNGGVFGSLFGTPIINPPQSAILGMHATKMRAVVVNGKVEARPMMYLALTYDHRMIDGREAVTFLKSIQNKIEDPSRLLLTL